MTDPAERFWMEITDREDLGVDLRAPKADAAGNESWSYTLVSRVAPGDRIFHWHKTHAGEPAIVGWSEARGPLKTITMEWQAHGSRGRARGVPTVGPAWLMPLKDFTLLDHPITRTMINARRPRILEVLREAEAIAGTPIYAPFQHYGGRELRAQQGYLSKFPAALVDLLFELDETKTARPTPASRARTARPSRGQGYQSDASTRAALEAHSVALAKAHYENAGAVEIEELGKPFDLRVVFRDGEERHVEVKGSSGVELQSVQLTQGEVEHAARWQPTDLFVVDAISTELTETGTILASGGRTRIWREWNPDPRALRPTHHRYGLPEGGLPSD